MSYRQNYKDRVILGVIDYQKKLWCANTHSEPGQFSESDTAPWLADCPYCVVEKRMGMGFIYRYKSLLYMECCSNRKANAVIEKEIQKHYGLKKANNKRISINFN
jgi:hypothetical protein